MIEKQQLFDAIKDSMNPEELVCLLDLSTEDLCYHLHDCILECEGKFGFLFEDDEDEDEEDY